MGLARPRQLGSIDELDPDWMKAVLVAAGLPPVEGDLAIGHEAFGAGNVSATFRLRIAYEVPRADLPANLILKLHPADALMRQTAAATGTFEREAEAYRLLSGERGCRIPRIWHLSAQEGGFNLLMSDSGRSAAGHSCSLAEARAGVGQLAALHAAFAGATLPASPALLTMQNAGALWADAVVQATALARERFAGSLDDRALAILTQWPDHAPGWFARRFDRLTLTHGDARSDNFLFAPSVESPVATLIDWQLAGIRNPLHDVAYFLSGSMTIEARRAAEEGLLELYAEAARQHGLGYRLAEVRDEYRLSLPANLTTTLLSVLVLARSEEVDGLVLTLLQRNCAAIDDWDCLAALARD